MAFRVEDVWLTAAECARRTGLSVRALRLYESHGLITPRRTGKQWRLYGAADIARLNEVLALKNLGISLTGIAQLMRGSPTDLGNLLAVQKQSLGDVRQRAERGLQVIDRLNAKLASGQPVSIDDLTSLAKETNMTDTEQDKVAWRRYEQARPRTEVEIDRALYEQYAGHYRLKDGPHYVVTAKDGRLFTRVVGQPDIEIYPESETQFFMKVLPVQVTFERDPDGAVNSLVHHQNGYDTPAIRVDADAALGAEAELERRIREKEAQSGGEAALRRIIDQTVAGAPDYESMSPPLAALARQQHDIAQAEMQRAGTFKSLTFKGVGRSGFDLYNVAFENLNMEWGISLNSDGKIGGLFFHPTP
jgi:DNA-binding transcriptional MerR regulator